MNRQLERTMTHGWYGLWKSTAVFFLPTVALMVVIAGVILSVSNRAEMKAIQTRELRTVAIQQSNVDDDILHVLSDLDLLSNAQEIDRLWNDEGDPIPMVVAEIESYCLSLITHRRFYDQIRLLGESGMEVVRTNYNKGKPAIVPDEELQNKKGRYYFDEAFALNRGDVFVSPLDLNIEHGRIEQPLKPMIRFATPVYDRQGTKRGIVLLNYCGSELLGHFADISSPREYSLSMLLNVNGYWLKGPDPTDEWGFMYESRKDRTFANEFPKEWEIIQSQDGGQFETPKGVFTYATVYPLLNGQQSGIEAIAASASSEKQLEAKQYYWKIVSHIPPGILSAKRNSRLAYASVTLVLLSGILLWGSWLRGRAVIRRKQAEHDLAEANRGLEIKIARRTAKYAVANEQLQDELVTRSRLQAELECSANQWRETFDVMSDCVFVQNIDMELLRVNKSLAEFLGKTPEELIGKHCCEFMHGTQEPWPTYLHQKAIEKREMITEDIDDPCSGTILLVTCSPVVDKKGATVGTVQVARDITDQKCAQKEREALVKKLQTMLDEIKVLRGILPICSVCKRIRNDEGYYEQIEGYIHKYADVDFSHTICPKCMKEHYSEYTGDDES